MPDPREFQTMFATVEQVREVIGQAIAPFASNLALLTGIVEKSLGTERFAVLMREVQKEQSGPKGDTAELEERIGTIEGHLMHLSLGMEKLMQAMAAPEQPTLEPPEQPQGKRKHQDASAGLRTSSGPRVEQVKGQG